MVKRVRLSPQSTVLNPSPVLITESAEEFERFNEALHDELKPRGPLERYLVGDMAGKAWEVRRLRRVKTSLINSALRPGLQRLLEWLMPASGKGEMSFSHWQSELNRLAEQWFADGRDKKEVLETLEQFQLDENAIEAAAVRFAAPDLEKIDRLLASLESRLSKALRSLGELGGGFGRQLHANVERIIDGEILAIDGPSKNPPAAA
jgi:hypothetical protein